MARLQIGTASASSQADLVNDLGNKGYLVFGLILFVWELLPTTLLVGFFRVHRPPQDLVRASGEGRHWRSQAYSLTAEQWRRGSQRALALPEGQQPAAPPLLPYRNAGPWPPDLPLF